MQFLVVARDGTDADAEARRRNARPAHSALVAQMKLDGRFVVGGHTLDDDGRIAGSAMIVEFPSRDAFEGWLESEPYVVEGVWKQVDVTRINLG